MKDCEISIVLKPDVFFEDIRTVPQANAFQNHVLLWKVKI